MTKRSAATGSGEGLAKVSYLPGVVAPSVVAPSVVAPDVEVPSAAAEEPGSDWAAEERRAENVSMHALTRRGMSRWELGEVLLSRDLDVCIVEAELDRLEGVGLIDDAALAETIVRTQHERKGLGRSALVAELRRRRIDQEAIDEALEQLEDGDEEHRAIALAERRAPQLRGLDHATAVRRLSGYLQRKGYSGSIIRMAVERALPRAASGVRFR
jgi:regulatory protein